MHQLIINDKETLKFSTYSQVKFFLDNLFKDNKYFNILNPLNYEPIDFNCKIKIFELDHIIELSELDENKIYINY